MTSFKDIAEQGKNIVHDISDVAQLGVSEVKQEIHQQITKEKVKNKIDDMQCTYNEMKKDVKEAVLNKLDSL